jgi:hypothetical protein
MKTRHYVVCPVCPKKRMRRLGKSDQPSAPAPSAVERYYGCPGCGLQQAYASAASVSQPQAETLGSLISDRDG